MISHKKITATIMVATDQKIDANIVQDQLQQEFEHVVLAVDEQRITIFDNTLPDVLVLAFKSLKRSEQFYLELYRQSGKIHLHHHRTVVLCSKQSVNDAYELCRREVFDDYIMFWPMSYDAARLRMSVHNALREQRALKRTDPDLVELTQQTARIAELEQLLKNAMDEGSLRMTCVDTALHRVEQDIGNYFEHLNSHIRNLNPENALVLNDLQSEIARIKRTTLGQTLQPVSAAMQPIYQWMTKLKNDYLQLAGPDQPHSDTSKYGRPNILLIDDDQFLQKIVSHQLDGQGYDLIIARDATEALRMLRNKTPDLVLLDIVMPGVNGMEALRRFRQMPTLKKTPFIMLTGNSEGAVVVESLKLGANDFIAKPFDRVTLLSKINRLIGSDQINY